MFEGIKPAHTIDDGKLRELALHANLNPHFVLPPFLKKEIISIDNSPALQVSQDVIINILAENFGLDL
jgi:hypothetical protein